MILPAEKTKNPKIHPMISTTATRYNILLIKNCLVAIGKTSGIPKRQFHRKKCEVDIGYYMYC